VFEVSGQTSVPVLVDGETVLDDEYEIIDYLKQTYPVNS
jgi:glutathione S-transferase